MQNGAATTLYTCIQVAPSLNLSFVTDYYD
jgi:hypothetical protein